MSVKIDLAGGKILQQMALDFKNNPSAELNKFKLEFISDMKEISEDSKNLRDVDPKRSTVEVINTNINFNIVFYAVPLITFSAGGSINKEEKTLEIDFKYQFPREVFEKGNSYSKEYSFILNIKAGYEESPSFTEKFSKDEILAFIQKLVNNIFDRFNDGKKSLRNILFDQKDVERMASLDSGEIAGMVQSLIGAVISFSKFKEINDSNNHKASVVLRQSSGKKILNDFSVGKIDSYSAEIKEIEEKTGSKAGVQF